MLSSSSLLKTIFLIFLFIKIESSLMAESHSVSANHLLVPEFVLVGDPGNDPDLSGYGAVSESFFLSKYPITVDQWAFFMNCVHVEPEDQSDFRGLYHSEMCDDQNDFASLQTCFSGIEDELGKQKIAYVARSLKSNFFSTKVTTRGSFPITNITPDDAKRYCNWCEHGCPQTTTLEEALAVTENGAYDFTNGKKGETVIGAIYSLPTADLLYKAMYYKSGSQTAGYWSYPTKSDSLPTDSFFNFSGQKRIGANIAVTKYTLLWKPYTVYYTGEVPYLTPVDFFNGSSGPYGHYDLGGNVRVWSSSSVPTEEGTAYLALGGSWKEMGDVLKSSKAGKEAFLSGCYPTIGLRIAAFSGQSHETPLANLNADKKTIPSTNKSDIKKSNNLFLESLKDMAYAQITSYILEAILNAFFLADPPALLAMEVSEAFTPWLLEKFFPWVWKYLVKSCDSFTLPRNLVNAVLTLFNAAGMSAENSISMKDDSWETIALLTTESIITMVVVEGAGALVEKPVEWLLNCLSINSGANKAEAGWTLVRLFLNVYYIGSGTYFNVHSDIKNYQKDHSSS